MRKILLVALVMTVIALAFLIRALILPGQFQLVPLSPNTPTSTVWPFDPALYDVPDTIAGHKVVAVISADNTMCVPPRLLTLVVRAGSPDPQSYPGSDEAGSLDAAMGEFAHPGWTWSLMTIGPDVSLDNWQEETEKWNKARNISGCEPYAPAIVIESTPTP